VIRKRAIHCGQPRATPIHPVEAARHLLVHLGQQIVHRSCVDANTPRGFPPGPRHGISGTVSVEHAQYSDDRIPHPLVFPGVIEWMMLIGGSGAGALFPDGYRGVAAHADGTCATIVDDAGESVSRLTSPGFRWSSAHSGGTERRAFGFAPGSAA
jgi:hypothetical protein